MAALTPELFAFAVRSIVRLGGAARAAWEQGVRDQPIKLADLPQPPISDDAALWAFFYDASQRQRVAPGGDLAHFWDDGKPVDAEARDHLRREALRLWAEAPGAQTGWLQGRLREEGSSLGVLKQWAAERQPPGPLDRLALGFADVVFEFAAAHPVALGAGSGGERLVSALAANLRSLLPDVDDPADWQRQPARYAFAERSLTVVLRAGLAVAAEQPGLFIRSEQYQSVLGELLQPLLRVFDEHPQQRPNLAELRDMLLGPMARAVLATAAAHPAAFAGRRFGADTALGAVTAAVLDAATTGELHETFTADGLLRIYRAALDVAAQRPGLFVDETGARADVVRSVLSAVAATLASAPPPFGGGLAADVAVAALAALKGNVPGLMRLGADWGKVVPALIEDVLQGLAEGLQADPADLSFEHLFTNDDAVALVSTLLRELARTPGLLGEAARGEVRSLVAAVGMAVTAKGSQLLRSSDWIELAQAAATEAARNPLRLAGVAQRGVGEQLLTRTLVTVLNAADQGFAGGRSAATLLFGDTLRESLALSIQAAAGNAARANQYVGTLATLVAVLNGLALRHGERIGAREWLFLYRRHVAAVLDTGLTSGLTDEALLAELTG